MYYVYILRLGNGQLYTGFTSDLKRRMAEHHAGKVKSTQHRQSVRLIHYEAYALESDARRREKFLKTTEGKRLLKQQIRDALNEIDGSPRQTTGRPVE
jgi:putative endonuclease